MIDNTSFPSLKDTTVVIFGGSSGIGLATAKRAAVLGAQVVISARDQTRLEQAIVDIGHGASSIEADVKDETSVCAVFDKVGPVNHVFVSAAQVIGGLIDSRDLTDFRAVIDSRFWGGVYIAKHASRTMVENRIKGGSLTFTTGLSVTHPTGSGEAIAASSAGAVDTLVRALALELAPIRVNCVAPGIIDTALLRRKLTKLLGQGTDEALAQLGAGLPVGRVGTAEEVAAGVIFLMSNSFVTGTSLLIDGGQALSGSNQSAWQAGAVRSTTSS